MVFGREDVHGDASWVGYEVQSRLYPWGMRKADVQSGCIMQGVVAHVLSLMVRWCVFRQGRVLPCIPPEQTFITADRYLDEVLASPNPACASGAPILLSSGPRRGDRGRAQSRHDGVVIAQYDNRDMTGSIAT